MCGRFSEIRSFYSWLSHVDILFISGFLFQDRTVEEINTSTYIKNKAHKMLLHILYMGRNSIIYLCLNQLALWEVDNAEKI